MKILFVCLFIQFIRLFVDDVVHTAKRYKFCKFNCSKIRFRNRFCFQPDQSGSIESGCISNVSNVKEEKDIGVTIDDDLTFEPNILEIVKKANKMCGMIRRNFEFLDAELFPLLYKTVVRPHLEYAAPVWSPRKIEPIKKIEGVQRRATKYIPGMSNLTYPERLKKLKLPTLMYRRLRGDLIEVYKIMKPIYDSKVRPVLTKQKDVATYTGLRGYTTNLYPRLGQKAIRKQSSIRVVEHWNSLPIEVQTCDTVKCFKNRIDEIYISKDIYYNFPHL